MVPILFDKKHFNQLIELNGHARASEILKLYKESVIQVFVNSYFKDIDNQ